MAKPIFIATIAGTRSRGDYEGISQSLSAKLEDYHVLLLFDDKTTENKFQLLSDKDIEPTQFEELKALVVQSLN